MVKEERKTITTRLVEQHEMSWTHCVFVMTPEHHADKMITWIQKKYPQVQAMLLQVQKEGSGWNPIVTPAERQIIQWICNGMVPKQIAQKRNVSIHTIRNQVQKIYKKCGVKNRVQLMLFCQQKKSKST